MTTETTNERRLAVFADAYCAALVEAMAKHPERYLDTPATAHHLASRMTAALARGTASLGDAAKIAAKRLGIRPTLRDIRAWLSEVTQ